MRCPFCYEKIPKYSNVCNVCGFNTEELKSASNKLVDEMKKKDPECIIKVTTIPDDMNAKKLLLLAIFGGMLGLHAFYSKRYGRGFFCLIATTILFIGTPIIFGYVNIPFLISNVEFTTIVGIFGALSLFVWVTDTIAIIFGKYKIPVVLKDKI